MAWIDQQQAARLGNWLGTNVEGWDSEPVGAEPLSGGSSATVLKITQGERRAVLRAPQIPPRPDSDRALRREARVLKALAGSAVPHPGFIAFCEDEQVIGAYFLISEFVDGWLGAEPPVPFADAGNQQRLALALIDALAQLHGVDHVAAGLEDFGRPAGFLERQVDQWTGLFQRHRGDPDRPSRELADEAAVASWLREHRPDRSAAALIHCDASFSNVMFGNAQPPRVAALIDWEIATIGDPLLDLGRAAYPFPDERGFAGPSMMIDHGAGPSRQMLAARYAERSGRSVEDLDWFMVLAMFKLAALIEPNYARDRLGQDPSGLAGRIADFVVELLAGARAIIDRSEPPS